MPLLQMIKSEVKAHVRAEHGGPHSVPNGNAPKVVDHSSNTGPLRPPQKLLAALRRSSSEVFAYPDPDAEKLCTAIAARHKISRGMVIAGNGATEIIYEYCRAFVKSGMPVLVQAPTFAEYASASSLCGGRITRHATMDIAKNVKEFASHIPKNGCVFLCNPNNPTGTLVSKKDILHIAKKAANKGSQLFVDECFMEFAPKNETVIKSIKSHKNLFVLRSFTKIFGIPGVRIGYGVGSSKVVSAMSEAKPPWSVSGMAQLAGITALKCGDHITKSARTAAKETDYLYTAINSIKGMSAIPSMANFVLASSSRHTGRQIRSKLLKKGFLIRDCSSFEGLDAHFIRIAARTHNQNVALVQTLESL